MGLVMTRMRIGVLAGVAALAAIGLGTGIGVAVAGGGGGSAGPPATAAPASPGYAWYQSVMGRYASGGGMMGGPGGWMMGPAGYQWMTGGAGAPGWMRGGTLPSAMMGGSEDPGTVMGRLFADAPGPRVSPAQARRLGSAAPAGAVIGRAARTITFTSKNVSLVVLASPSMPAESFQIAGLTNPAITVPAGAHVRIVLVNADADMAHGLVITASDARSAWMPMMAAAPAFSGSALWFLGSPTSAGMHEGTLTFTAAAAGTYHYLCPVPGHAQKGMAGTFTVRAK
jgi:rusticyanin